MSAANDDRKMGEAGYEPTTRLAAGGAGSRALYAVLRVAVAGLLRVYLRPRVTGRENIPRSGAFVLAPVHRSNMDTLIVPTLTRRRLRFMGKHTLWKNRFAGWFLSSLGGFPVVRGTADRDALRSCIEVVNHGEPLVLFPEGERKSGDVVQPLFDGAAYVAARAGVPIVPVGIAGSERVMPKGSTFIYPRRIAMTIGAPITLPVSESGRVPRSAVRHTTDELHGILQNLYDEATQLLE